MKKTYIAPEALIVDIETQFVIAYSPTPTVLSLDADYEVDGGSALQGGSRSNLWGED